MYYGYDGQVMPFMVCYSYYLSNIYGHEPTGFNK